MNINERQEIEQAIFDILYNKSLSSNVHQRIVNLAHKVMHGESLLYFETVIVNPDISDADREHMQQHTILQQACLKDNYGLVEFLLETLPQANFGFDIDKPINPLEELNRAATSGNERAGKILDKQAKQAKQEQALQELESEFEFIEASEDKDKSKAGLIRKDQLGLLRGNIQALNPTGKDDDIITDGWVIQDEKNKETPVNNEINMFFMGTAGAPLFGGHTDIYEGGDVLCNLALQKAFEDKKRVMLMRGVGTAKMSPKQPITYLENPYSRSKERDEAQSDSDIEKGKTEGGILGNLLGTEIEQRIQIAMELYYVPEMIEMISKGQTEINVNITGHSRGAITTFAMADCVDKWMGSVTKMNEAEITKLTQSILKKNPKLELEQINDALHKVKHRQVALNTRLLGYDPVEGRTGLGNIRKGFDWRADFKLPIFGNNIDFTYSVMPASVKEAKVILAQAEFREAFQPTIPKFHRDTLQDISVVVGGHGTMKGNLSDHTNTGQDSYPAANKYDFIKEAGRATIDLGRADVVPFLFKKHPPFQMNTILNIFSLNEGKGYVKTKRRLLDNITVEGNVNYDELFEKIRKNEQLLPVETKLIFDLCKRCQKAMREDADLTRKLYFDLSTDIHEIYLNPADPIKKKMVGEWFSQMKRDTTDAGIKLFTTDSDETRKVWERDANEEMIRRPLTKKFPCFKFEPKSLMWYPDNAQIGGLEQRVDENGKEVPYLVDQRYTNPYLFNLQSFFAEEETSDLNPEQMSTLENISLQFYELNKVGIQYSYAKDNSVVQLVAMAKSMINNVAASKLPEAMKVKILATLLMKAEHQYKFSDFSQKTQIFDDNNEQTRKILSYVARYHIEKICDLIENYPHQADASSKNFREIIKDARSLIHTLNEDGYLSAMPNSFLSKLEEPLKSRFENCRELCRESNSNTNEYIEIDRQIKKYQKAIKSYREPEGSKLQSKASTAAKGAALGVGAIATAVALPFVLPVGIAVGAGLAVVGGAAYKAKAMTNDNPGLLEVEEQLQALQHQLSRVTLDDVNQIAEIKSELANVNTSIDNIKAQGPGALFGSDARSRQMLHSAKLYNYDLYSFIADRNHSQADIVRYLNGIKERDRPQALSNALVKVIRKNEHEILGKILNSPECLKYIQNSPHSHKIINEGVSLARGICLNQLLLPNLNLEVNFEKQDQKDETILHSVLKSPYLQSSVDAFMSKPNVTGSFNLKDNGDDSILHLLVKAGRVDILNKIDIQPQYTSKFYYGIYNWFRNELFAPNQDGLTPMMLAVFSSTPDNLEANQAIIELLSSKNTLSLDNSAKEVYLQMAQAVANSDEVDANAGKEAARRIFDEYNNTNPKKPLTGWNANWVFMPELNAEESKSISRAKAK